MASCGSLFVWTFAPVPSTTEERWSQDAEDLSQCLSQQQSLQRKEEEDIPQCLRMYEQCLDGSIHLLYQSFHLSIHPCMHPSIHACMHACIQIAKGKQTDSHMNVRRATWIDDYLKCIEQLFLIHFDEFQNGTVIDQSLAQF